MGFQKCDPQPLSHILQEQFEAIRLRKAAVQPHYLHCLFVARMSYKGGFIRHDPSGIAFTLQDRTENHADGSITELWTDDQTNHRYKLRIEVI